MQPTFMAQSVTLWFCILMNVRSNPHTDKLCLNNLVRTWFASHIKLLAQCYIFSQAQHLNNNNNLVFCFSQVPILTQKFTSAPHINNYNKTNSVNNNKILEKTKHKTKDQTKTIIVSNTKNYTITYQQPLKPNPWSNYKTTEKKSFLK